MVYVQPADLFSSIMIGSGVYGSRMCEHDFVKVDGDFIMREADMHFGMTEAIAEAFSEVGVKCLSGIDIRHPLAIEIRDEDVDKVVNLSLEIAADDVLDEDNARQLLIDYCDNFMPPIVRLTGSVCIEGFEEISE